MTELKRELGLFEASIYGIGIILGAGIYALIGQGAGLTGNSLWLSFLIGAIVASFTGLSYAELSSMFPKAAAEYFYVKNAFGSQLVAFMIGWLIVFTGVTAASAVSLGFSGYLKGMTGMPIMFGAIMLILLMSYVNFRGIKESSRLNIVFTSIEAIGLILIIALGFSNFSSLSTTNYLEMPNGMGGLLSAAALVFFAYIGFEDIANLSEETKNAKNVLSKAFIIAIIVTTVLYVLTSIATVSLVDTKLLSESESPLALAASQTFLGNNAFVIISIIALFATANTVLVMIIVGSRMLYGMGRDGSVPKRLSDVHPKYGTPHISTGIFTVLSLLFLMLGDISFIANVTSLGAFLTFFLVNASLILLRFKEPNTERPYKAPLNIGKLPILATLGVASTIFMMAQFELGVMIITGSIIFVGVIFYTIFNRKV